MKILSVHNKYQIRGGEDESRESEERLLREHEHIVDTFEEDNTRVSSLNSLTLATKTIWSSETYQNVHARLQRHKYDIVHVQNFFPLISPSVHYAAYDQGVPVVQTLRNYRLLCPNGLFFRNGNVCEDCVGKPIPYPGVVHSCYKGNRGASAVTATMLVAHRALGTWTKVVDRFITLTNFARNKFIEGGLPPEKIVVKPNFVHPDPGLGSGSGGYALYVGRLSVEKGIDTLLHAWKLLNTDLPLKIVGDGPLVEQVCNASKVLPQIEWLGRKPIHEVHTLMGEAQVLIFPSKWYETFGRVAVESFAKGTPVIASNIGAIAELIDDGETGLLFEPGDASDLATKIDLFLSNSSIIQQMRGYARNSFVSKFTAQSNYQFVMDIYSSILDERLF